jgi:two-component system nitrate/nitrite sensor histidine kinase NarX
LLPKPMRESLLFRLALAIGGIALLALLSVLTSSVVAETSAGEAGAINLSGSLRMLTWKSVVEAESGEGAKVLATIAEFDSRMASLQQVMANTGSQRAEVVERLRDIDKTWRETLRPKILAAAATRDFSRSPPLYAEATPFVGQIDAVVRLIETDLESRILLLRVVQAILLVLISAASLYTFFVVSRKLAYPLRDLLQAALTVRQGNFAVQVRHQGPDELGQLGAVFNTMVENLSHLYSRFESLVAIKTRELEHSNHSLNLLYRTTSRLSEGDLTQEKLLALLQDVEDELGLGQGIICVRQNEEERAYPLATNMPEQERVELCDSLGCSVCFGAEETKSVAVHSLKDVQLVSVPLTGAGQWQGVMPFQLKPGTSLEPWQIQVLEAVGQHVATALANTRRAEERHRLAVHEERSVIARELHDSIAQSLSYLKIQIALLQGKIRETNHTELLKGIEELKVGLGSAYSELRELLNTFRLSPSDTPFAENLSKMVNEYSRRCGFPIELQQHLGSMELSANEEIHVTSIIREALTNIQRHAHASWARVQLAADTLRRVQVTIEDNGVGLKNAAPTPHHYGLIIMRDRAAILNGQILVENRTGGGARVNLSFVANTPYAIEDQPLAQDHAKA